MELDSFSGNIKLRLPKSLHAALLRQSKNEGVSLNQICLMYLSAAISYRNLGSEEFNHRLELIANECVKDEKRLFERLNVLNQEVEALRPILLQELKEALDEKKRQMKDFVETLRHIYPVYAGDAVGEKLPILKVPSAKIVLRFRNDERLGIKDIERVVNNVCPVAVVAYGDYDYYTPFMYRIENEKYKKSVVINIRCNYCDLEIYITNIREELDKFLGTRNVEIRIKPCYTEECTSTLLQQKYGISIE